jgi:phosphoribosyl-ATP pyrophosphohydrolase
MKEVLDAIDTLLATNAYHVKRGFRINESNALFSITHMLEEAVEFQAAALLGHDRNATVEEAADTLHSLRNCGISLDEVEKVAIEKLAQSFTDDPNKVTAISPGLTRRSRAPKVCDEVHWNYK